MAAAAIEYASSSVNGAAVSTAASILQAAGDSLGAIILPAFSSVDDSDYFDLLANSSLSDHLDGADRPWVAVNVTAAGKVRYGAFILGMTAADARQCARSFGQPAFQVVDAAGTVAVKKTFA